MAQKVIRFDVLLTVTADRIDEEKVIAELVQRLEHEPRGEYPGWSAELDLPPAEVPDEPLEPIDPKVLVVGDPFNGLSIYGPVKGEVQADCRHLKGETWHLVDLYDMPYGSQQED